MVRLVPLLAFVVLVTFSLLLYMLLSRIGLGWVVIAVLAGMLTGLVIMLRRQSRRPEFRLLNRANRLYLERDYNSALALYSRLLERNPDQPQLYNLMATCYANLEQFEQAARCFEKVTGLQPQNADAFTNLATVRARLEPLDETQVVASLDRAWQLIPQQRQSSATYFTLLKLGFTELEIERYPQAIEACNLAMRLQPGAHTPRLVRGLSTLLFYEDDPVHLEQGRADLIEFLRHGFDTEVSLRLEVQYLLKAREFLIETGGLPDDLRPNLSNTENF